MSGTKTAASMSRSNAVANVRDVAAFLASLDQAKAFLAACSDFDDAKTARDKAVAMRAWARAHGDAKELGQGAAVLEARALRRMGELAPPKLSETEKTAPATAARTCSRGEHVAPAVSPKLLHRARAMAAIPVEEFESEMAKAERPGAKAPSVSRLLQAERQRQNKSHVADARDLGPRAYSDFDGLLAALSSGHEAKFGAIYADPPWAYANKGTRGTSENEYETAEAQAIETMPVAQLAADDCFLFMWATSPLLPEGLAVMKAWGFNYRSSMVWDKHPRMGLGNYARIQHEFLLIGIKGRPEWIRRDVRSVCRGGAAEHSAKPPTFRPLIESVCAGPYVELFARTWTKGWASMGNEVDGESELSDDVGMFAGAGK